jgi:aryl-alcohol dehydrogenase-like predicted oxidoreductase
MAGEADCGAIGQAARQSERIGNYGTPIEETLEALNDVVRAGKTRYIGASSMYAWQFANSSR